MVNKPITFGEIMSRKNMVEANPTYQDTLLSKQISEAKDLALKESAALDLCINCNKISKKCTKHYKQLVEVLNMTHSAALNESILMHVVPYVEDPLRSKEVMKCIENLSFKISHNNALSEAAYVDRLIRNDGRFNVRFGINEMASRYVAPESDYSKLCEEICEAINTYDSDKLPVYAKVTCAIDECVYTFMKNGYDHPTSKILESVIDYFLSTNLNKNEAAIRRSLLENMMFSSDDANDISYILYEDLSSSDIRTTINNIKKKDLDENGIMNAIKALYVKSPEDIIDGTPNILAWIRQMLVIGTLGLNIAVGIVVIIVDSILRMSLERHNLKKMVHAFDREIKHMDEKIEKEDDLDKVESLEKYRDQLDLALIRVKGHADSMGFDFDLEESAKVESAIRNNITDIITLTEAEYKFNNILDIALDANKFIKDKWDGMAKNVSKKTGGRIQLNSDEEEDAVKNLGKKIADPMINVFKNIKNHIMESDGMGIISLPVFYVESFDMLADRDILEASVNFLNCKYKEERFVIESTSNGFLVNMYHNSPVLLTESESEEVSMYVGEASSFSDTVLLCSSVLESLESCNYRSLIRDIKRSKLSNDKLALALEALSYTGINDSDAKQIRAFVETKKIPYSEDKLATYTNYCLENSAGYCEGHKDYDILVQTEASQLCRQIITEELDGNDIILAVKGMADKAKNFSIKEKELSHNIDIHAEKIAQGIKNGMTNDRREAVIKGSIIPSFSKCIKAAIALVGVAVVIDPVIASIAAIGAMAMSKKLTDDQRMLLLDEMEIELKVIDKELQNAENDNNMKNYRSLLAYQRKLKKEIFKIRYKLTRKTKRDYLTGSNKKGDDDD